MPHLRLDSIMPKRDRDDVELRPLDQSFRVVIPPEVRERLDLDEDDYVAFQIDSDGVHLRKAEWTLTE